MSRCRRIPFYLTVLALAFIRAVGVHAQTVETLYEPPTDYVEKWAKIAALFLIISAFGLIAYVLTLRRRRFSDSYTKWILFIGVCLLPFPVMLVSTAVGLEQAKAIEFCDSCHVMGAFVRDMKNPESDRLAAKHFKNRYIQEDHCYICHTNYGLFGTVEAKVGGLAHIWKETAGTYQLPIKVRGTYQFTICLNCHGQSMKFLSQDTHEEAIRMVINGEGACTDCHDLSHPPRDQRISDNE